MPNHMSTPGFQVQTSQDFANLAMQAVADSSGYSVA
jgi:hypothetical protein